MDHVGLVVNPSAGRDIRRLTGAATVSDNYGKRRVATAVLVGLASVPAVAAVVVPDKGGLGQRAADDLEDEGLAVDLLEGPVADSGAATRAAAARLRDRVDVVVVLGGDGTTRDVALGLEDAPVPILAISTGTNNVVPTHVDGTAAGVAAGLVASGAVPTERVTVEHGMVEAVIGDPANERRLRGLATLGVLDVPFVGTRAVLHGSDYVGGAVSRADPGDIGLSGIAGAVGRHAPTTPGGPVLRFGVPGEAPRTVRAITAPGVVERLGVSEYDLLDDGETASFEVPEGVLSVDGERDLELVDASVDLGPIAAGPTLVDVEAVFDVGGDLGRFVENDPADR